MEVLQHNSVLIIKKKKKMSQKYRPKQRLLYLKIDLLHSVYLYKYIYFINHNSLLIGMND